MVGVRCGIWGGDRMDEWMIGDRDGRSLGMIIDMIMGR